ncbi:MAG TPA: glycosyltransferase [Opitutales bacterium]|nr:glycosyltransferase [Opitutales bacterium]
MEINSYTAYVPVYNQAATLGACLAALRAQTIPPDEILVVDDGSTDNSVKIAEAAGVTVLKQEDNLGRGAARARAMATARNEFVLGCDAGNRLPPDFAARALKHFANAPRLAAVHGWFLQSKTGNTVDRWRCRHLFARPSAGLLRNATHVTSGCMARRTAIISVGNYDSKLRAGEDAELGRRLQAAGWEVWLDPDLGIENLTSDTVASVFERYARWNETDAPAPNARLMRDYFKRLSYAVKVLAVRDLREGDFSAAFLSLALPHYLARRACQRKRAATTVTGRLPVVHYVNTYIEPWLDQCWRRESVSRAHLWGADALESAGFEVRPIRSLGSNKFLKFLRRISHTSGGRLGDLAADWLVFWNARRGDIVYIAAGHLVLTPLAVRLGIKRLQLVAWIYKPASGFNGKNLRGIGTTKFIAQAYIGWLALTPHVEAWLKSEYPAARVRRVVWAADTEYYPSAAGAGGYFAATGVTQRDYSVLLQAARAVNFPFVILGPAEMKAQAPANVDWRDRNRAQAHATIDDDQLRKLYHGARAILIPLQPDPDDASGFTNILEAIACGRPVVMTRTGALDLTPAVLGIGFDIAPGDSAGWIHALQTLANEPATATRFAARAAELARDYFNLPRFEKDLVAYFLDLAHNRPEPPVDNVVEKLSPNRKKILQPIA